MVEPTKDTPTPQEREDRVDERRGGDLVSRMHSPILRERMEPRDGYEPVPLWLVGLFGVLIFWGGWYMAEYSGGWSSDVLNPHPSARYPAVAADQGPPDPMVLGKKLFTVHCVSCHQQGGQGVPGQYPPLVGSDWVTGSPARLKRILLQGLEGAITVNGEVYNGNMPAFAAKLKDEHLAAVLTYIRGSWGNEAEPISDQSVAATRQATVSRTKPWSEVELKAITNLDFLPPADEEK
jgi:mono/diheme cytochrome c family protein